MDSGDSPVMQSRPQRRRGRPVIPFPDESELEAMSDGERAAVKRRLRNRTNASKSRKGKEQTLSELRKKIDHLQAANKRLHQELQAAKSEITSLRKTEELRNKNGSHLSAASLGDVDGSGGASLTDNDDLAVVADGDAIHTAAADVLLPGHPGETAAYHHSLDYLETPGGAPLFNQNAPVPHNPAELLFHPAGVVHSASNSSGQQQQQQQQLQPEPSTPQRALTGPPFASYTNYATGDPEPVPGSNLYNLVEPTTAAAAAEEELFPLVFSPFSSSIPTEPLWKDEDGHPSIGIDTADVLLPHYYYQHNGITNNNGTSNGTSTSGLNTSHNSYWRNSYGITSYHNHCDINNHNNHQTRSDDGNHHHHHRRINSLTDQTNHNTNHHMHILDLYRNGSAPAALHPASIEL